MENVSRTKLRYCVLNFIPFMFYNTFSLHLIHFFLFLFQIQYVHLYTPTTIILTTTCSIPLSGTESIAISLFNILCRRDTSILHKLVLYIYDGYFLNSKEFKSVLINRLCVYTGMNIINGIKTCSQSICKLGLLFCLQCSGYKKLKVRKKHENYS